MRASSPSSRRARRAGQGAGGRQLHTNGGSVGASRTLAHVAGMCNVLSLATTATTCRRNAGFAAYRAGDWPAARAALEETAELRRNRQGQLVEDGPSATLLR